MNQYQEMAEANDKFINDLEYTNTLPNIIMSRADLHHIVDLCYLKQYTTAIHKLFRHQPSEMENYEDPSDKYRRTWEHQPFNKYLKK